jgi:hypothetical protein
MYNSVLGDSMLLIFSQRDAEEEEMAVTCIAL